MYKVFKNTGFRIFVTVWVVYIFYLQMYGSSCMANTQSALTAAIVNEHKLEIDTYEKVSCDSAWYNGHYYSGMSPGISFISVPIYSLSKIFFTFIPEETIDFLFKKLEKYGDSLPMDMYGDKKILSNYFPGLSKKHILEYIIISGFILPIFTTALISAISSVLFYLLIKKFNNNDKLAVFTTFLYSFGTITFPTSTEFFQRPIAISFAFASFFILFKIRHNELRPNNTLFIAGILAGLAALFDYFFLIVITGLLFLYLVSINLGKDKLQLSLRFIIGALIPIFLLFIYHYIVFNNPFTTSYNHRSEKIAAFETSKNIPLFTKIFHILELFLYSPILFLGIYGIYKVILIRNEYYPDAISVVILTVSTLIFIIGLLIFFPYGIELATKRYMSPILPYLMMFLPNIFSNNTTEKQNKMKFILVSLGLISILINWIAAQYGGHHALDHSNIPTLLSKFLKTGHQSSFLDAFSGAFNLTSSIINITGLAVLISMLIVIWRPTKRKLS